MLACAVLSLTFPLTQRGRRSGAVFHPWAIIGAPTCVTVRSVMALHDEPGHVCSTSAAASTAASSRHRWDGGIPDLHLLQFCHLCSRSRTTTLSAHGVLLPLATERLQPPIGQSWGRRESRTLTSYSPCRCVYGHMLTSLTFMDVSAARDNVQSHTSIRPGHF